MNGRTGSVIVISLGLAILSAGRLPNAPQAPPTPMELFQKMLPAIRHDRCTNCHGVVDPETNTDHDGGLVSKDPKSKDFEKCTKCHKQAKEWQIPGEEHFFAGRTDKQVCSQISDFVETRGRKEFIEEHVKTDDQIVQAFLGMAGGAKEPSETPEPPSMSHGEFIQAAINWVNQGEAACEIEGTIVSEEAITSADTFALDPRLTTIHTQTGTRTATIKSVGGGKFRADISVSGEVIQISTMKAAGCTMVTIIRDKYEGTTTGPATVTMKDTVIGQPPPPGGVDYRIDVVLPREKTERTTTQTTQSACGPFIPPTSHVESFEWPSYSFTIEGTLDDVKYRNATGGCYRIVTVDKVNTTLPASFCNRWARLGNRENPWIVGHGGFGTYHDGRTPIPVHVNVTWNLRRR